MQGWHEQDGSWTPPPDDWSCGLAYHTQQNVSRGLPGWNPENYGPMKQGTHYIPCLFNETADFRALRPCATLRQRTLLLMYAIAGLECRGEGGHVEEPSVNSFRHVGPAQSDASHDVQGTLTYFTARRVQQSLRDEALEQPREHLRRWADLWCSWLHRVSPFKLDRPGGLVRLGLMSASHAAPTSSPAQTRCPGMGYMVDFVWSDIQTYSFNTMRKLTGP